MELKYEPHPSRPKSRELTFGQVIDAPAPDRELPVVGTIQCPEDVQERALAHSGHAQNSQNRATHDVEIDPGKHRKSATRSEIRLLDSARFENDVRRIKRRHESHLPWLVRAWSQPCRWIASTGSSKEARQAGYKAAAKQRTKAARMTAAKSPSSGRTGKRSMKYTSPGRRTIG